MSDPAVLVYHEMIYVLRLRLQWREWIPRLAGTKTISNPEIRTIRYSAASTPSAFTPLKIPKTRPLTDYSTRGKNIQGLETF